MQTSLREELENNDSRLFQLGEDDLFHLKPLPVRLRLENTSCTMSLDVNVEAVGDCVTLADQRVVVPPHRVSTVPLSFVVCRFNEAMVGRVQLQKPHTVDIMGENNTFRGRKKAPVFEVVNNFVDLKRVGGNRVRLPVYFEIANTGMEGGRINLVRTSKGTNGSVDFYKEGGPVFVGSGRSTELEICIRTGEEEGPMYVEIEVTSVEPVVCHGDTLYHWKQSVFVVGVVASGDGGGDATTGGIGDVTALAPLHVLSGLLEAFDSGSGGVWTPYYVGAVLSSTSLALHILGLQPMPLLTLQVGDLMDALLFPQDSRTGLLESGRVEKCGSQLGKRFGKNSLVSIALSRRGLVAKMTLMSIRLVHAEGTRSDRSRVDILQASKTSRAASEYVSSRACRRCFFGAGCDFYVCRCVQ